MGRSFLTYWSRLQSQRTFSITGKIIAKNSRVFHNFICISFSSSVFPGNESGSESENETSETEEEFEDDLEYLRSLDPKETKDQDHYRVLGITKLRINATDDQIKKAYR